MIQVASKIWSVENEFAYQQILDIATKFDPPKAPIFYLLRVSLANHNYKY